METKLKAEKVEEKQISANKEISNKYLEKLDAHGIHPCQGLSSKLGVSQPCKSIP